MIKPTHKAIQAYYKALQGFDAQDVHHETGVRAAFQTLLADVAGRERKWTLIPELSERAGPDRVVPDGTLRDSFQMPRGYWEAKDTDDDLGVEIRKKIALKYPTTNIVFEDTRQGVLYQDGQERLRADLSKPQELADLLNLFLSYCEPNIEEFEKAVEAFKERVPELARGLIEKIQEAHRDNPRFIAAFQDFFALCQGALNPNISRAAVDEMLAQHLLTERLFRTIFENEEFTRRNVIAAEVEKVIAALVSRGFSRADFLKSLDRFYMAIEDAARRLDDFAEKQHFLNTVYERFFQGYSVKVADTHGIVYTPQPVVDFMCASVEEVLKAEFGKTLSSRDVYIIDPCTGTGNFIVNLLRRIPKRDLPRMYREQMFANEVMLMPYYIASMNIEHAYWELSGEWEAFEGLCFVDTLDLAEAEQRDFVKMLSERNTARVQRQKSAPITVIIGNPPYNVGQLNENDNNKNRKYTAIEKEIKFTYAKDSKATNKNALSDAYVKFFRWATDRLEGRDGIVCFISNNSFVDQIAFDGMRKHLLSDFTRIYHLDLHGNVRKNPKLSGTTHNVFGIQVGVGITVAIRQARDDAHRLSYVRVPEFWRKEEKLAFLVDRRSICGVDWQILEPDPRQTWLVPEEAARFGSFICVGRKAAKSTNQVRGETIFELFSGGVKTNRDEVVYDYSREELGRRVREFAEDYNSEVDRFRRVANVPILDDFVNYSKIKWSRDLKLDLQRHRYASFDQENICTALYRPFNRRYLYFDRILNEEIYSLRHIFSKGQALDENQAIICSDIGFRAGIFSALITNTIPDLHLCAPVDAHQCFPFYTYEEDGSHRRENITDWALQRFREQYKDETISKWDIFYYVYGLLHHPGYRAKYADCLKRELPRIPFAADFRAFSQAGQELARWHLDYETVEPYELQWIEAKDRPLSYRVEDKMRLSRDKTSLVVNPSLTLAGIPAEAFDYRLGNRSALDWVIDQYRVETDPRSGIVSDPNRADDPEYIVNLVGRVLRVSLETVRLVHSLPADFGG